MDLTALPFNQLVGLRRSESRGVLLTLPFSTKATNHLGTVHAGAIYTLAEAASGAYLIKHRGERHDIGGVVRKASSKYSAPAASLLKAYCEMDDGLVAEAVKKVDARGRALLAVPITIRDEHDALVGQFTFEWMLGLQG